MTPTILVTGGAGFIGSNLVRWLLQHRPDQHVLNLDALTYAGNLESLQDVDRHPHYTFVQADLADREAVQAIFEAHDIQQVAHLAAESHVDRSILDPAVFIRSNVMGTQNLLDAARAHGVERFLQVSTDEVYGTLGPTGAFTETTPLAPNSPYSASKAGADLLVRAAFHTHGFPGLITRCSNNYGPYQFPEKLIPLMLCHAMEGKDLPVYGDGLQVRDWLHVEDHCAALVAVLERGTAGEVYNIGGNSERDNLTVVKTLLSLLGKGEDQIRFVTDRPGHDRRYAIDARKVREELAWEPSWTFEEGLRSTVAWYQAHQEWVDRVRSGAYRDYYRRQYQDRGEAKGGGPGSARE